MTTLKLNYESLDDVAQNYKDHAAQTRLLVDSLKSYKDKLLEQKALATDKFVAIVDEAIE